MSPLRVASPGIVFNTAVTFSLRHRCRSRELQRGSKEEVRPKASLQPSTLGPRTARPQSLDQATRAMGPPKSTAPTIPYIDPDNPQWESSPITLGIWFYSLEDYLYDLDKRYRGSGGDGFMTYTGQRRARETTEQQRRLSEAAAWAAAQTHPRAH